MTSFAIDLATPSYWLNLYRTLAEVTSDDGCFIFSSGSKECDEFISWHIDNFPLVSKVKSLKERGTISASFGDLNAFLEAYGISYRFQGSTKASKSPDDGIATFFDLDIDWLGRALSTRIYVNNKSSSTFSLYDGYWIPPASVQFFCMHEHKNLVAQISTKSGYKVWMTYCDPLYSIQALFYKAIQVSKSHCHPCQGRERGGIFFPRFDLKASNNIFWLENIKLYRPNGNPRYTRMFDRGYQSIRIRGNETYPKSIYDFVDPGSKQLSELVVNKPFLGWVSPPENDELMLVAFYCDLESWDPYVKPTWDYRPKELR